jgi:hypothetical protein
VAVVMSLSVVLSGENVTVPGPEDFDEEVRELHGALSLPRLSPVPRAPPLSG